MRKLFSLVLLLCSSVFAQSNSWQPLQPYGFNFINRNSSGCLYEYGAPSGAGGDGSSTGVVAQWIFDETSGDIVDEISSITLADQGTPSYDNTITGDFSCLSPSIDTSSGGFTKASGEATIDPGTSDFIMEWVATRDSGTGNQIVFETDTSNNGGWQIFWNASATALRFFMRTDGPTTIDRTITFTDVTGDGEYHKYRVTFDRDGNIEGFLDGVSQGTGDMSGGDGESFVSVTVSIGQTSNNTLRYDGKFAGFRMTIGNLTNNSGGPGGG